MTGKVLGDNEGGEEAEACGEEMNNISFILSQVSFSNRNPSLKNEYILLLNFQRTEELLLFESKLLVIFHGSSFHDFGVYVFSNVDQFPSCAPGERRF